MDQDQELFLHLDNSFILPDEATNNVTDPLQLILPPPSSFIDNLTMPDLPGFPPLPDQPDTPVTPLPPLPFTPTSPFTPDGPFTPSTPIPLAAASLSTNFYKIDLPNHPTVWVDEFDNGYIRTKSHASSVGVITTYLKCRKHVENCKGTANVKNDTLHLGKPHSCSVTPGQWAIERAKAEMKQLAVNSTLTLKDIYNKVGASLQLWSSIFFKHVSF